MKSLLPKRVQKRVRRKSHHSSAVFFALLTTLSLFWVEVVYRFFTTQAIFNGDIIHILLLNASFAFVFVSVLSFLPSTYHRVTTFLFLLIFILAAPVFTTLTLSHTQYGQLDFLLDGDLYALYQERYRAFIRTEFWFYGLGLLWLLIPFKIHRRPVSTIGVWLVTSGVVVGTFFYLINPNYANITERTNNWDLLIYQENPGITRSRLGINQATIRTMLNRPLFIRPQEEDILGEISEYFVDNDTTTRNVEINLRNKNLLILQVEGLTYRAFNSNVMPFTTGEFYDESIRFVNYYADQKEIDNYGVNFSLVTGIPTLPTVGNTAQSYAFNNYPYAIGSIFRENGYNTASFFQYYANLEDQLLKNTGFTRQFDYFDFPNFIDNDADFLDQSLPVLYSNRTFLAYYNLNNPHANRTYSINESLRPLANNEADLEYLSQMYAVDQAIERAYNNLEEGGVLRNTAILVIGTNPNLSQIELSRAGRILQYKVPMLLNTGNEGEDIRTYMGATDIIPTLMSIYRLSVDNQYLGSNILVRRDNIVGFNDGSWITDIGHYDSLTQRFAMNPNRSTPDTLNSYVRDRMVEIQERYRIARLILERNYYGVESI